jgi:4-hydroxy-tetrahydrodipicolinate synthase
MVELRGVFVVLVTPFTTGGEVDHPGMRRNIEWLIGQGVHGLIPLGSTGEFASLGDAEKEAIMDTVAEAVRGRVPVVTGVAAETTEQAAANARAAEKAGASGVLLLPPWYYTPSQDELVVHFRTVAESVGIPLMIYNNPSSSKVDIAPETVARMAATPNIRYVKESTGDIRRITAIRDLTGDRVTVFCGWEDMAYESFLAGAGGWVCVIGNVAPRAAVDLFDLVVERRDLAAGWRLYRKMLPLLRFLEYAGKTHKALKHALDAMGLAGGGSSSPKLPLDDGDRKTIDALIGDLVGAVTGEPARPAHGDNGRSRAAGRTG